MNTTIPEALHICPGCKAICSGGKYCARCREEIEATAQHLDRVGQKYSALPRETGVMPEASCCERFLRWLKTSERIAKVVFWACVLYGIYLFVH